MAEEKYCGAEGWENDEAWVSLATWCDDGRNERFNGDGTRAEGAITQ